METGLQKKYSLSTAISMVVGIVIGSGVFFKAEKILLATGGDILTGIFAWLLGGLIMLICTCTFSILAGRYESVGGLPDYAGAAVGDKYAYLIGWFMCLVYYPTLTAALSWVSARYTCILLGMSPAGGEALTITAFFLIGSFAVNTLAPILAGRVQVACTVIKLIPLFLMGGFGIASGLSNGVLAENLAAGITLTEKNAHPLFTALTATAFAYDGWIVATCINAELKDARRNLPRALIIGSVIVILAYISYYTGLAGALPKSILLQNGEASITLAFEAVFSKPGGVLLIVFVIISCLGSLNGMMLGCSRGLYALAVRHEGPKPHIFSQLDSATNMPANSAIGGLLVSAFWLLYYYGSSLGGWFGAYGFDMTELPTVTMYASYIPIFIMMIKKERQLTAFGRFVLPSLSVMSCLFMIFAACFTHRQEILWYLLTFVLIMLPAFFFMGRKK